ncbi:MAG: hypothetical protein QOF37_3002, partial [Thermoleophilaceae bacterium]|nr:hypothetical protein [Thermoleophilaceae bacterium]
ELAEHPATAVACRAHAARFSWEATADAYQALYRAAAGA